MLSLMRAGFMCLSGLALSGCNALFPHNVKPPSSVFVDGDLAEAAGSQSVAARYAPIKSDLGRDVVDKWLELNDPEGDDPAAARAFLLAGVSLIDARCDEYFRQLGLAAQKTSFASKELNLTTSVVAALQGLTSVASKDIALTATSLGFVGASSAAYADAFIFSPDVSSVQALVSNAQKAIKDRIREIDPDDFSKAVSVGLVQDYEKTCEVHTIRRLVNESLSTAKPVASYSSADAASALLRQATRLALASALSISSVTERQMIALYWLALGDQLTDADKQALIKILPAKFVTDTKQLTDMDKSLKKIIEAFRSLVTVESAKLDAEAAALRKSWIEQVAAESTPDDKPSEDKPAPGEGDNKKIKRANSRDLFAPALTITIKQ